MQKGQAIIEFMFLILIVVVYLTTTTLPLIESTQQILMDSENVTRGHNETQKIINTINEVNLFSSGTKQTLTLFIPNQTQITCDNETNTLGFKTTLNEKPFPLECPNGTCEKETELNTNIFCFFDKIAGPQKIKLVIRKNDNENIELITGEIK